MIVECPGCKSRYDVTGRPAGTRARCRCGTVFALPAPTASAHQLNCPNCGAGVAPTSHGCEFCRAELLVRACPRCFARIFHGHHHCPHCGVEVVTPAQADLDGGTHPRRCPACDSAPDMTARLVGGVLLDDCGACHGIWLDVAAVERVVRERGAESLAPLRELGQSAPVPGAPAPAAAPRRMYIKCPDCGAVMNRVNFGRRSGIIVDVCRGHGTWFDSTELPRVIAFVMGGGLEEAQRRQLEEMKQEARRARAEAEAAGSAGAILSRPVEHHDPHLDLFGAALTSIVRLLS